MASYCAKRVLEAVAAALFVNSMYGKISRTAGCSILSHYEAKNQNLFAINSRNLPLRHGPPAPAPNATRIPDIR
jgi:hypothetical protein